MSCRSQRNTSLTPVNLPVPDPVVKERLVPVYISPDSALLTALFECDSNNQVILRQMEEWKGKSMESDLSFENGRLDYKAKANPDTVYLPGKDSLIYVPQPVEVRVEVNRLTWWQETWIRTGKVLSALAAFLLIFILIRKQLKK